jgi:hypothetical protein
VLTCRNSFVFLDGLLAWHTERVGTVEVIHHTRASGRSGYSIRRLVRLALNLVTSFSLMPLRTLGLGGMALAGVGAALTTAASLSYLAGGEPASAAMLCAIAVTTTAGLQLIGLGVVGEYVGRANLNLAPKPQFHERRVLGRTAGARTGHSRPGNESARSRGDTGGIPAVQPPIDRAA